MPEVTSEIVPGVGGTVPDPEDPAAYQEAVDYIEDQRRQQAVDAAQRSSDAKDFYSGGAANADRPEPPEPAPGAQRTDTETDTETDEETDAETGTETPYLRSTETNTTP